MPQIDEARSVGELGLTDDTGRLEAAKIIAEDAIRYHGPRHIVALFSGGHDSVCATHFASTLDGFTGVFHANTGIGIEQTREYVRQTCNEHGWRLWEYHATDPSYDDLVLDKGFPRGPKSHNSMYWYLKQKSLDRFVQEMKDEWSDRIMLVTGIRTSESVRRMGQAMSQPWTRTGAQVWVNPILLWSKLDTGRYMAAHGIRRNPVVDTLHRSGECLCGAFANANEIHEIEEWYPDTAERIYRLERRCEERGLVDCRWAQSQAPGKRWDEVHESEVDLQMCLACVADNRKPMPPP
ncbi:MAG: phosphoadenosine phosphosulfate reductase family protein [Gammaproteobacteria bacterium]|uniref:Phosphoadenosine phosphosulfate reductase family protein n=1 Tax=Candidatus Kutchimonas denitrificans TaxID=3056748 RepID=A0AAE4ZB25_9BACT|nr:phosphoadenosine phosphosulfate reductase family protein [Candidatus Kutchimonas denitrificans]NIV53555.1 phosphoadenosine phosphosulfate reductase family protein [Gammaproteobacteria bacterium]